MDASESQDRKIDVTCRACGSRFTLSPGFSAPGRARECLVCPVCLSPGPALEDVDLDESGRKGRAECRPSEKYRLLPCFRPDGPELEGASAEMKELARMLWRLAGGSGRRE